MRKWFLFGVVEYNNLKCDNQTVPSNGGEAANNYLACSLFPLSSRSKASMGQYPWMRIEWLMSTISSSLCHIALTGSPPIITICYAPQSVRKLCRAVINKYIQYTKNVSIFYNNLASLCGCCCRWKWSWKHYTAKEPPLRHCWWCWCRQQSEEREQKQRRRNETEIKKKRRKKYVQSWSWLLLKSTACKADTRSAAKSGATSWETDPDLERGSCCATIVKCAAKHYAAERFRFHVRELDAVHWKKLKLNITYLCHVLPTGGDLNLRNG